MKKILVLIAIFIISVSSSAFADTQISSFRDVSDSHWALGFINSLTSSEIIGGYPDGSFKPQDNIKINEFIAMTIKALGYRLESKSSDWAKPYVDRAIELGIIEDREFDSYTAFITREQMTSIVMHAIALNEMMPSGTLDQYIKNETKDYYLVSDYYKQAMLDSYKLGIITGFDDKTFRPRDFSNRAQAAAVISKVLDSDFRQPFEKTDIRYTMVPTTELDEFGNIVTYDYALYAPLLNGEQVTEMIDVAEIMTKNIDLGKGHIKAGYSQFAKAFAGSGVESKEISDWLYQLTPYDYTMNIASYKDITIVVDFNNYNVKYGPYDMTFRKRASILERYPNYSTYYLTTYGEQLKPLFQYWFEKDFETAWNLFVKGLDAKGNSKQEFFNLNGRAFTIISGSDVCTMGFSLKK